MKDLNTINDSFLETISAGSGSLPGFLSPQVVGMGRRRHQGGRRSGLLGRRRF